MTVMNFGLGLIYGLIYQLFPYLSSDVEAPVEMTEYVVALLLYTLVLFVFLNLVLSTT